MHTVLGLSLNSNYVAWVLVDADDGTVLDHDALELHTGAEIAGASARSAQLIARACGLEIDRVRLTWTDDVARDGLRLRKQLGSLGMCDVEAVPMACATSVLVDPETVDAEPTGMSPRLALAYGTALAVVGPSEAITVPVVQEIRVNSRLPRRRIVSALLGVAAAALLGLLFLSAGASPPIERPATTAEGSAPSDTGWATVPAAPDISATVVRKVVAPPSYADSSYADSSYADSPYASPSYTEQPLPVPAQASIPVRVVAATAPEPIPAPAGLPHLSDALPVPGPVSALAEPASLPAPEPDTTEPDMTEIVNALSALP